MKRLAAPIRALLAIGLFTMLILFIGGGTASAGTVPIGQAGSSVDACGTSTDYLGPTHYGEASHQSSDNASGSNLLTINRWGGVADNFHTRLDAAPFSDLVPALQRNVLINTMIQTGNSMWQGSTAMTAFATRFCLMDTLGYTADHLSANFGNAVLKGGLVTVMVVGGVVLLIWRARNAGSSPWKGIGRMVGILSLLGVMVTAAGYTGQSADKQHTSFAMGSPGFFGSTINNVISTLSNLPSSTVSDQGSKLEADGFAKGGDANMSCANATKALRNAYKTQYGSGMSQLAASIPLTMSQMWENTGLASWAQAQFGSANEYGPLVYCHVLEDNLNTPRWGTAVGAADPVTPQSQTQTGLLFGTNDSVPDGLNGDSAAWDFQANGSKVDQSMVGWAACRWNGKAWAVDPVWASVASGGDSGGGSSVGSAGGKLTDKNCKKWWETKSGDIDLKDENMNYEDNPGYIRSATSTGPQVAVGNFLLNWHGNDNGTAFTLAAVYMIAAFMMMVIFGGISLGIIVAKVAMLVLIALVAIALLMSLWPGSGGSRLTSYAKFYLGTALFTFGISVIFSLITMITGFLADAGVGQFGAGSLMATLWTGFSPIAAVVVLNMLFKHGLKMPSPLKPGAALAYGAAIGGIGMAAGAGVESMFNKAKNKGRNGVRAGGNTVKNSLRRGPTPIAPGSGGSQTMRPKNAPAPAGGSPVVAAAGATGPGVGAAASGPAAGTAAAAAATAVDSSTGAPTTGAGATGPSVGAAAAGTAAAAATAPDGSTAALAPAGAAGLGVVGGGVPEPSGDTAVLPATGALEPSSDTAIVPAAAGSTDETLPLPIPVPLPTKPLSPTAQRAADINDKRLARRFHRTGGVAVVTGRTAGLHRRTNSRLMNWAGRSNSKGGLLARAATAGAAMAGVGVARGAAGVLDNAQQRAVRRTRAGLNNAALFNRGKGRAKLAMATMRAKPLRTTAKIGAVAIVAANPGFLLGVGAIAARKGYNRARPKDHNGQRQSALAARRRNAPIRRSAKDQARLDAWSAHQNSVAPTLPNPGTGNGAPDRIDTGSSYSGARGTGADPLFVGGTANSSRQAGTMPSDPAGAINDRNYFDAAGRPPLFGDDDKRVILDEETHQVLPHARQDFEIEQSWLADQASAAGSPAATDYDVARSMRSTDNGRGHAINTGAVVPPASPRRPAVAPTEPSAAPAPVGDRRHSTPEAAPTAAPAAAAVAVVPLPPAAPRRPAAQGRPAAIANQRPIRRRPAGNNSSVRPNPTAAARASRPAAPVYSPARAVRPSVPVAAPSLQRPAPAVAPANGATDNGAVNSRAAAAPTPPAVTAPAPSVHRPTPDAVPSSGASGSRPTNISRPAAPAQPAPAAQRPAPAAVPSSRATDNGAVNSRAAAAPTPPVVAAPAPRRAAPAAAPAARQPAPQPAPRTQPAASASTRAPAFASRASTAGRRPAPPLQPSDPASTPAPDVPSASPSIGDPRRGRTSRD